MNSDPILELTILMPCLNEAETLSSCVQKALSYLERSGVSGEVLIADNGSTDGSQEMAKNLGARVVNVPCRGYGAALAGGIAAARGRYIIMGDADDSYDFTSLDAFVNKLREGTQLVMGNRFQGGIAPGAMPFLHKYVGNPVLSFLGRLFFHIPIGDFHCGLRGFDAEAVRSLGLKTTGMEFASEMVVKAALNKLSMAEVPTRLAKDGRSRSPHLRTFRDGWRHLCFLLSLAPKWLFIYPGLVFTFFGLVMICSIMAGPTRIGSINLEIKSFIFSCLSLLVGVQSLVMGNICLDYARKKNILPHKKSRISLSRDRLAMLAGALTAAGLCLALYCIGAWLFSGFGPLVSAHYDQLTVLALTGMAAGIQIFHMAFLYELVQKEDRP